MHGIERFIDSITMYRIMLYSLFTLTIFALVLSPFGLIGFKTVDMAGSLAVLIASSFISHTALKKLFASAASTESWLISALILFLIIKPASSKESYAGLVIVAVLTVAAKYVISIYNKHIFNPVAIALLILGIVGSPYVFWWVGSKYLLLIVIVSGILVARKLRHLDMVVIFLITATAVHLATRGPSPESLQSLVLSGPLLFFAFFMLTEPQTSPHTKYLRLSFAVITGALYGAPFSIGILHSSPELALCVGNLFSFAVTYKKRIQLKLVEREEVAPNVHAFWFKSDSLVSFKPGQYMEWTLEHKSPDSRGDRRYFTIASSVDEKTVKIAVRIDPEHSSSFKKRLLDMKPGDTAWVSQRAGDFILPRDSHRKIAFIAGGIGITPFRSMIGDMVLHDKQQDISVFYFANSAKDFCYKELFAFAKPLGLDIEYYLTNDDVPTDWDGKTGYLSPEVLKEQTPDYKERVFYISGPNSMVKNYRKMLIRLGVPRHSIKTDYFPGY